MQKQYLKNVVIYCTYAIRIPSSIYCNDLFQFIVLYLCFSVYLVKQWQELKVLNDHTALATGVRFGQNASFVASTSMDRSLKIFSLQISRVKSFSHSGQQHERMDVSLEENLDSFGIMCVTKLPEPVGYWTCLERVGRGELCGYFSKCARHSLTTRLCHEQNLKETQNKQTAACLRSI